MTQKKETIKLDEKIMESLKKDHKAFMKSKKSNVFQDLKNTKEFFNKKNDLDKQNDEPKKVEVEETDAQKIADLVNTIKRTQADFINYKIRVEKENSQNLQYSSMSLVKNLLPVLDSFELAIKSSNSSSNEEIGLGKDEKFLQHKEIKDSLVNANEIVEFKKGVEMVFAQFFDVLKQEGLRPIICLGKKFDPYMHEVLMKAKSDQPENIIIEEFQKGYMLKERVVRHSKVKISG